MEHVLAKTRRKVLVIDDNADAACVLTMFLSASGHNAVEANNGPDGLQLAASFMPDVVLLDLGMPGMDGYEVAVALRKLPGLANVCISALTGWNDKATRARVKEAGFDYHLTKPADVLAVLGVVDTCTS